MQRPVCHLDIITNYQYNDLFSNKKYVCADIGASSSAIPFSLYQEVMHEIGNAKLKILMWLFGSLIEILSLWWEFLEMLKFYVVRLNTLLIF